MPSTITEIFEAVREQAFEECMALSEGVSDALLGPDGEAPGDHRLTPGERIARFEDMAQRGVLDALESICAASGATHYDDLVAQYVKDVAASRLVGGS